MIKRETIPATSQPSEAGLQKATFAAGCFWGVEDIFKHAKGVVSTTVGYTGGHYPNPRYEDVCSDQTGHAEAVEVEFDSKKTTFKALLEVFWNLHDPTTVNRQGPDIGSQYRSAIFYHSKEQQKEALESKKRLDASKKYNAPIATEVTEASTFYPAEEYHQDYSDKHPGAVCHF